MKKLDFLSSLGRQSGGRGIVTKAVTVGSPSAHRRGAMLKLISVLVLILTIGVGQMWGAETIAYTLQPASGSNNSYGSACDVAISGITWNVTGNSQMQPWRIGGNSLSGINRAVYSKTAISDNISKIIITHGAASSITINSMTVTISKNSDFSSPVSTLTPTFAATVQ